MQILTDARATKVGDIARRNDVSPEAAIAVLDALVHGGGSQAQFSHPDLGGMGQWSRGGMVMVGDMFNSRLKARVAQLCTDLSELLRDDELFPSSATGAEARYDRGGWWPPGCGTPASSGGQNDMRYAYFPETKRLVIDRAGVVALYDTGDHRISGVSQQQSGTQDLTFTSQHGQVKLHELDRIDGENTDRTMPDPTQVKLPATPVPKHHAPTTEAPTSAKGDDLFAMIERLHGLRQKGILSDDEFADKKKELLARL